MRVFMIGLFASLLMGAAAQAEDDVPTQLVDAFNTLSGKHEGYRAVHAKGIVAAGTFTPSAAAKDISKALIFEGGPVPMVYRFSDGTGSPDIPDANPSAVPEGFAMKFMLPDGSSADIVTRSYNGFAAATGEEFLEFLKAQAASGPAPFSASSPLMQFAAKHPAAKLYLETPKPAPVSFATQIFYGVNAFKFTNAQGEVIFGRYRIVPVAGAKYLSAEEASKQKPDYLSAELAGRRNSGPFEFKLLLQGPNEGDSLTDATKVWPDDRKWVDLGTLTIKTIAADSAEQQKQLFFTPTNLIDGIDPSDDPLIDARASAYAVSLSRRM